MVDGFHAYGASVADWVTSIADVSGTDVYTPAGAAVLTCWTDQTDGTQITTLLDAAEVPTTTVTCDANGGVPRFYAPDTEPEVWLDGGAGRVVQALRVDLPGGSVTSVNTVEPVDGDVTVAAADVGAAPTVHTHDDRYYTETEADALLDTKQPTGDYATGTEVDAVAADVALKANTADLAPIAMTGSYNDLVDVPPDDGGGDGLREGTVKFLSEFEGADDDAKLTAAMSYGAAQTYKGTTIVLDEQRLYTFSTPQPLYSGFSLRGSARVQDQARSSAPLGNRVNLRTTGGWFTLAASQTFGVALSNLSIDGTPTNRLVDGHLSNVLWTSSFRDISMQNAANVLGSVAAKLLVTSCAIDGWWNVNNVGECAFVIGGSDLFIKPTELNLDTSPPFMDAAEYLFRFENLSNTILEGMYLTSDGHSAMLLDGGVNDESSWIHHNQIEGRNEDTPCPGALIRVDGGQYVLHDNRFAYAMTDPEAVGRDDAGVIHVEDGDLFVDRCTYRRAAGVAEDVPFVYAAGGHTVIRNVIAQGFTGKPVAYQTVDGLIDADDSVTLVTPAAPEVQVGAGNVTTAVSSTSSVTVTKPANIANGDLLVACIWGRNNDLPYTGVPSGWTVHAPASGSDAVGIVRFFTKPITDAGSEPADYAWTGGNSGRANGIIMRVTGADNADPVDATSAVATGIGGPERIIIPSVTATEAATLLLMAGCTNTTGNTGGAHYAADGVDEVAFVSTATGASESSTCVGAKVVGDGATGTTSYVVTPVSPPTVASSIGYAVAIKAA